MATAAMPCCRNIVVPGPGVAHRRGDRRLRQAVPESDISSGELRRGRTLWAQLIGNDVRNDDFRDRSVLMAELTILLLFTLTEELRVEHVSRCCPPKLSPSVVLS